SKTSFPGLQTRTLDERPVAVFLADQQAGGADHHANRSARRLDLFKRPVYLLFVTHIERHGQVNMTDIPRNPLSFPMVDVADYDSVASQSQFAANFSAYPAAGSGYHRDDLSIFSCFNLSH